MTVTDSVMKFNGTVRIFIFIEYFNLAKILNDLFSIEEYVDR